MLSRDLLQRIAYGWDKRARVRNTTINDVSYDIAKEDFIESLLPFAGHASYQTTSADMRTKVLACAWIIYNAKTIAIETDIVNPVCLSILNEKFAGTEDALVKQLVTETMIDESYHIHLCAYANEITKAKRNLTFKLPTFSFVQALRKLQDQYAENWQKELIQLAAAITSEIYITDYLDLVHDSQDAIQPLNRLVVKTHRSDELAHGKIFTYLAHLICHHMSKKQKDFFASVILQPLTWLADAELNVWASLLQQIGFDRGEAMLLDCQQKIEVDNLLQANDKTGVKDLLVLIDELGISNQH